jgi:ankyrin repeat protein
MVAFCSIYTDIADNRGDTPLHASACNGHSQIVAMLLQYNVTCTKPNAMGFTPLALAKMNGHMDCYQLLHLAELPKTTLDPGVKLNKDYISMATDYKSQQQYRDAAKGDGRVGSRFWIVLREKGADSVCFLPALSGSVCSLSNG